MSRLVKLSSALCLGTLLLVESGGARATLIDRYIRPVFYADIPVYDDPIPPFPNQQQVDDDSNGVIRITNGGSFTFFDYFYGADGFGTFMRVTFTGTQIILTNLVAGIFPEYTAADFRFVGSSKLVSVSIDPSSDPQFATGALLTSDPTGFRIDLSNTCATCFGVDQFGHTGESIVLNVAAIPEPATMALLFAGLLPLTWRRRKPAGQSPRVGIDDSGMAMA